MSKKILYLQENGKIAMITPAEGIEIESVISTLPPEAPKAVAEANQLPAEDDLYHFFDALTVDFNSKTVGFNLETCRELTKQRLRKERVPLFEKNDLDLRDAMLNNDTDAINAAVSERDRLRDITNTVYSVSDLAGLKVLHP